MAHRIVMRSAPTCKSGAVTKNKQGSRKKKRVVERVMDLQTHYMRISFSCLIKGREFSKLKIGPPIMWKPPNKIRLIHLMASNCKLQKN